MSKIGEFNRYYPKEAMEANDLSTILPCRPNTALYADRQLELRFHVLKIY
jgi:hypothetical protein